MKLYVYEYCPYCIKARMIFPLKGIPCELALLLDDDVATPSQMIGHKLLPILQKEDGTYMGESMDIVRYVDQLPDAPRCLMRERRPEIARWCQEMEYTVFRLAMPRWIDMPVHEFSTPGARAYYRRGKEAWLGRFKTLISQTPQLLDEVHDELAQLAELMAGPDTVNEALSEDDIAVFALLHQLSTVKGVRYPTLVETYRQRMAARTTLPLYDAHAI